MAFRFSKDQWLLLSAMICGISMVFLDASVLPVALPTIQKELGISTLNLQWIVNIFFLAEASFVIFGGKLGDIFGIRNIYISGLLLFGLASVLGGIAYSTTSLLVARALQGLGAALIAPTVTATIIANFPAEKKGKAIGISVAIASLFLSFGPFFGGFVTEFFSWRWIFFVNIFITLFGVILSLLFVPHIAGRRVRIDLVSLFLFAGALLLITLSAMEGERLGWFSIPIMSYFFVGVIFAGLFYLHYRSSKDKEPFFDFSLFKNTNFFIGNMHAFIVQVLFMNTVFWAIFFQLGLGFSPVIAGLLTFFSAVPVLIAAPVAGHLSDKYGAKLPVALGFSGLILTFFLISLYTYVGYFPLVVAGVVVFGFCGSQILTPTGALVISSAPVQKRGLASGIYNTMRFSGATLGMAVLGSIYTGTELS
ncbi:MFS transporter, partial [bacterium]|nr:MFS transporter [bacterium]